MDKLDYLMKSFDKIDESEKIKQIWFNKLCFYIAETVDSVFLNPNYDENYFLNFTELFKNIYIKHLLVRDPNNSLHRNKFYLL